MLIRRLGRDETAVKAMVLSACRAGVNLLQATQPDMVGIRDECWQISPCRGMS